ncbi:hypothetical protein ACFRCG_12625 [Embleya sp. NPDC056575]
MLADAGIPDEVVREAAWENPVSRLRAAHAEATVRLLDALTRR